MAAPVELRLLEPGDAEVKQPRHGLGIRQPRAVAFAEVKIDLVAPGQAEL